MSIHFHPLPVPATPVRTAFSARLDNRAASRPGDLHLTLTLGGKRIRYAYIRKNGCSSFKAALGYPPETRISVVAQRHRARWYHRFDATTFVWRDPEERLLSLYRNKIIEQRNSEDIWRRYRIAMGEEPSGFDRFVEFAMLFSDPHCRPQAHHLGRLAYSHAIPLHRLHDAMRDLVGDEAAQPFLRPVNSSTPSPVRISPRARQLIRWAYADDYRMISRLA
ncbi:sulfotransferase family 2 domain-containing protein [Paracoccus aestuariivivens]|uniref:Uncharacterized protein n=1 Tax=Paracoccus aestuariivivens TaxID=1820333 RepID=A0A6L6JJ02_9RHOB|nr:sulfotransferase family 2 domain-containing protein [Paracoccus aestuariivivens]MTH80114.1 hypothetical protein [Paracoccus aestuariivivens]